MSIYTFSLLILGFAIAIFCRLPETVGEEPPTGRIQERSTSTSPRDRMRSAAADAKTDPAQNKPVDPVKAAQEKRAREAARARG